MNSPDDLTLPVSPITTTSPTDVLLLPRPAGRKAELERTHSRLSMLGLGFAILNSWTALSASLSIALPSGGPSAVLWGLLISGICNGCLAASLGEFLSAYPTAGGQYHWLALLAPPHQRRLLSWLCGWLTVAGWLLLVSTGGSLFASLTFSIVGFFRPHYSPAASHIFALYTLITLSALYINTFFTRHLPRLTKFAMLWSLAGIATICATLLTARVLGLTPFSSPKKVLGGFINTTGYPPALAWALGLLQGSLALIGYDAVAHMVEELSSPTRTAPRVMVESVAIGCASGFSFCLILLLCATSIPALITAPEGPLLAVFLQTTHSVPISLFLMIFPLGCLFFATTGIMATASRMLYAFARDCGLPYSSSLSKIHPTLHTPLNALLLTTVVVELVGLLYFVSTAALNALIAASVLVLSASYAFPVVVHMLARRRALPASRPFVIPGRWGWVANSIGVLFVGAECLLFVLPPRWPWRREEMNWCIVVLGVAVVVASIDWVVGGRRKAYVVPKWDSMGEEGEEEGETLLSEERAGHLD